MKKNARLLFIALAVCLLVCTLFALASCNDSSNDEKEEVKEKYTVVLTYFDENGKKHTDTVDFSKKYGNSLASYCSKSSADYTFSGFYSKADGEGDLVFDADGDQCDVGLELNGETKVYAYLSPIECPAYFYDYNGILLTSLMLKAGETVMVDIPTYQNGYDFASWKNGDTNFSSSFVFYPSQCVSIDNEYTFKAVTKKHVYTVYLDYNEDSCTALNHALSHSFGDRLTSLPTKDLGNKKILYWSAMPFGEEFNEPITSDITLFAVWMEYRTVTLSLPDGKTDTIIVYNDGNGVSFDTYDIPGYEFLGFYSTSFYSGNPIQTIHYADSENTLYGRFDKISYTLSFDTSIEQTFSPITYKIGDNVALPTVTPNEGYTFKGWSLDGNTIYTNKLPTNFYGNLTLHALYTPITYSIKLMVDGGLYKTVKTDYHSFYTLPVPTKAHYTFLGWANSDGELVTDGNGESIGTYSFVGTSIYSAKWIGTLYTITFNVAGGTEVETQTIRYGETLDISELTSEKDAYYFDGWFDETLTNPYENKIAVDSDMTIYAKWIISIPISNADDLKKIADDPTANYHLLGNINLRGDEWTPISEFSGVLNGNGYKIYNFTLTQNVDKSAFILCNKGTIKNVQFDKITFTVGVPSGEYWCYAFVAKTNNGKISNVSVTDSTMMVTLSIGNTNNVWFWAGGITAHNQSTGTISDCYTSVSIIAKIDIQNTNSVKIDTFTSESIGAVVGENYGAVIRTKTDSTIQINEYVYSYNPSDSYYGHQYGYYCNTRNALRVGGILGVNNALTQDCSANVQITLSSNANASSGRQGYNPTDTYRTTHIGALVGEMANDNAVTIGCASSGSISVTRIGNRANNDERYVAGIVAWLYSGSVCNCTSSATLTLEEGYMHMGGVACYVASGMKVYHTSFTGTIETKANGVCCAGGLVTFNNGSLSQSMMKGTILGTWNESADVVCENKSTGSVTNVLNLGNLNKSTHSNEGSLNKIYENVDANFFDEYNIYEDLCVFDSEYWGVCEGLGVYLKTFAQGHEHHYGETTCIAQTCEEPFCQYMTNATTDHSFTNYVSDDNADLENGDKGTETATCDHGCGATDTRKVE